MGGAVTGELAAATCGMSLGATIAGSAMAGTAGYLAENIVAGKQATKEKKQARKNIVVFLLFTVLPPWLIPLLYSFIVIRPFIKVISFVILFFSVSFAIALSAQIWMYIKLQRMKFDESAGDIEN